MTRRIPPQEGAKSNTIITCREHGDIHLTVEQHAAFIGSTDACGRCPYCKLIPKVIRRAASPQQDAC